MTPCAPRRTARLWAPTAMAFVPLLVVTSLPACATLPYRDSVRAGAAEVQSARPTPLFEWARVEAVRGGTPLTVQLHEVNARQGRQMIEGRFYAATADTLTLTLDDGQTRTLAKSAIDTMYGPLSRATPPIGDFQRIRHCPAAAIRRLELVRGQRFA